MYGIKQLQLDLDIFNGFTWNNVFLEKFFCRISQIQEPLSIDYMLPTLQKSRHSADESVVLTATIMDCWHSPGTKQPIWLWPRATIGTRIKREDKGGIFCEIVIAMNFWDRYKSGESEAVDRSWFIYISSVDLSWFVSFISCFNCTPFGSCQYMRTFRVCVTISEYRMTGS